MIDCSSRILRVSTSAGNWVSVEVQSDSGWVSRKGGWPGRMQAGSAVPPRPGLFLGRRRSGGDGVDAAERDQEAAELGAVFEAHANGFETGLVGADEPHDRFHADGA